MSDEPPGFNAPRRKSRFRSQYEQETYRRRAPETEPASTVPPQEEDLPLEEAPPKVEGEAETLSTAQPPTESADRAADLGSTGAPTAEGTDDLPPNFRLTKVYESRPPGSSPLKNWRWLLVTGLLFAVGLGGGYFFGVAHAPIPADRQGLVKNPVKTVVAGLSPELQAQLDSAFEATKHGRYPEARERFTTLTQQHPEWWSMPIETARASLYLHDAQGARRVLNTVTSEAGLPDASFITALLHLTNKELDLAEDSFATAVARDPARPDFFYFWGECLRRDGKPLEAVEKFRAALLRNQYENAEGLYQTKLWLSQIQADQEAANKEIDTALALPRPSYEALFAAAARELKGKRYPQATEFIARAQAITEPSVFRVILEDATFAEEAVSHPEIKAFYR